MVEGYRYKLLNGEVITFICEEGGIVHFYADGEKQSAAVSWLETQDPQLVHDWVAFVIVGLACLILIGIGVI